MHCIAVVNYMLSPFILIPDDACGPYGHDIHLQEICAAWKRPPVTEMSVKEYEQWMRIEQQLRELKKQKDLEQMRLFRKMAINKRGRHTKAQMSKVTQSNQEQSNKIHAKGPLTPSAQHTSTDSSNGKIVGH